MASTLVGPLSLKDEAWREYDFGGRTYRITAPKALFYKPNGSTHRVVDTKGVVHCVPAPGQGTCVLRWQTKTGHDPVLF